MPLRLGPVVGPGLDGWWAALMGLPGRRSSGGKGENIPDRSSLLTFHPDHVAAVAIGSGLLQREFPACRGLDFVDLLKGRLLALYQVETIRVPAARVF